MLLIFVLVIILVVLQVVILIRVFYQNDNIKVSRDIKDLETNIIKEESENFQKISEKNNDNFIKILEQNKTLQVDLINTLNNSLNELRDMNDKKLTELRLANEEKLSQIDKNINERLDVSLNERIDKSFLNISEQLSNLYKATGEMKSLTSDVTDLKKTLANVKTRGVFGERQLESILSNILIDNQYVVQYKLNNEDRRIVDFAIKIPEKSGDSFIFLPIDSKFPNDYYNKVVSASESGNEDLIKTAVKELRVEVLNQAKSISEKYIIPPITTDFALMFLPTEGLYSECLRIDNLAEECQNKYKILLVGPTTISAIINSLSIGFRYLKVNEKSIEINKMLQAIRSQYDKFGEEVEKAKDYLGKASDAVEKIDKRRGLINSKLKNIDKVELNISNDILGIDSENYS